MCQLGWHNQPWTYPTFVDTYYRGTVRGKESALRRHTHYSTEFRAEAVSGHDHLNWPHFRPVLIIRNGPTPDR